MSTIKELAPRITQQALRVGQGLLDIPNERRPISSLPTIQVLSTPNTNWAQKVDEIEAPFAPDYDTTEYQQNRALALMGLQEMRYVLQELGVPTGLQTQYECQPLQGQSYLDVGCGTGRIVVPLAALGGEVTAFDPTAEYVSITASKVAQELANLGRTSDRVNLYQCLAEHYPYVPDSFDGITALFGVLNHVEQWDSTINSMVKSLKPGGKLLLSMYGPNNALVFKQQQAGLLPYKPSLVQSRADGGIILGDSAEVLPAKFPSPQEIAARLEASGMEITKTVGFLRIAALFPQNPTPENIRLYKELVRDIDPKAADFIDQFENSDEVLLSAFLYDQRNQDNIDDFAYVFFVAERKQDEN